MIYDFKEHSMITREFSRQFNDLTVTIVRL